MALQSSFIHRINIKYLVRVSRRKKLSARSACFSYSDEVAIRRACDDRCGSSTWYPPRRLFIVTIYISVRVQYSLKELGSTLPQVYESWSRRSEGHIHRHHHPLKQEQTALLIFYMPADWLAPTRRVGTQLVFSSAYCARDALLWCNWFWHMRR
jgi:hypothetical protein